MFEGDSVRCNLSESTGISSLKFNPWDPSLLAVSLWGQKIEIFDVESGRLRQTFQLRSPQLAVTWGNRNNCFGGGDDGVISVNGLPFGNQNGPVSALVYNEYQSTITSSSFDGTITVWDQRSRKPIVTKEIARCVYRMVAQDNSIICGCSECTVANFDLRAMESIQEKKQYQIRSLAASANTYAVGYCEGRISIESDDPSLRFAFKSHNHKELDGTIRMYPVHAMCFHPSSGCLISGGGDGWVYFWNLKERRRIDKDFHFDTSIAAMDILPDGSRLAVGVSYCFEEGDIPHPDDELVIFKSDSLNGIRRF